MVEGGNHAAGKAVSVKCGEKGGGRERGLSHLAAADVKCHLLKFRLVTNCQPVNGVK